MILYVTSFWFYIQYSFWCLSVSSRLLLYSNSSFPKSTLLIGSLDFIPSLSSANPPNNFNSVSGILSSNSSACPALTFSWFTATSIQDFDCSSLIFHHVDDKGWGIMKSPKSIPSYLPSRMGISIPSSWWSDRRFLLMKMSYLSLTIVCLVFFDIGFHIFRKHDFHDFLSKQILYMSSNFVKI